MTIEPCPRGCGKPSTPRHTCIDQNPSPKVRIDHHNAALDACHYAMVGAEPRPSEEKAIGALRSGLQVGHLAVVDAEEVAELRRKASHYHAQRVEADERNARLEDALRDCVDAIDTLIAEHSGLIVDDELHDTCAAIVGSRLVRDQAKELLQ